MRFIILSAGVIFLSVIQNSLLVPFSWWGVRPDLLLIVVVSVALIRGAKQGATVGIIGGLIVDLLGGDMIGLGSLVKGLIGYVVGTIGSRMFWDNFVVPIALVFIASSVDRLLFFSGAKAFGVNFNLFPEGVAMMLPGSVYDAATAMLLYPLMKWIITAVEKQTQEETGRLPFVPLGKGERRVRGIR